MDLTACDGVAIDVSVPEGQRTGVELLVFLNTTNGERFLGGNAGDTRTTRLAVLAYGLRSALEQSG
jgi:hypothetical protein